MAGVYLGGLTQLTAESLGMQKLGKGFGLLAIIYGAVLLVGSLAGSNSMLRPLAALNTGSGNGNPWSPKNKVWIFNASRRPAISMRRWRPQPLHRANLQCSISMLTGASRASRWKHYTFTDGGVQNALANSVLLQADVTANDAEDQAFTGNASVFSDHQLLSFSAPMDYKDMATKSLAI